MTNLPAAKGTDYGYEVRYNGDSYEFLRHENKWICVEINDGQPFKQVKQGKQMLVDAFGGDSEDGDLEHIEEDPANTEISPLWNCVHPAALLTLRLRDLGEVSIEEKDTLDKLGYITLDGTLNVEYAMRELNRVSMTKNPEILDDYDENGD